MQNKIEYNQRKRGKNHKNSNQTSLKTTLKQDKKTI